MGGGQSHEVLASGLLGQFLIPFEKDGGRSSFSIYIHVCRTKFWIPRVTSKYCEHSRCDVSHLLLKALITGVSKQSSILTADRSILILILADMTKNGNVFVH